MRPTWLTSKPLPWLYRLVIFITWGIFRTLYRHKVYGLEHYYKGAAIIAGNHVSYYDPPVLSISWPEEVHFLAREGLFKTSFFGGLIRRLNSHPIGGDAGDITVFKTVCGLLNGGKKVILFPEGTRNTTDVLAPLKPGIAVLIARTGSAVIPAYIHGTFQIWSRTRKFPKLWGRTACVFGTPIPWSDFTHLEKKAAQKALLARLAISMNALRSWYEAGAQGFPP